MRSTLGRKQLAEVGATMMEAKKGAPTHPHPTLPDAGAVSGVAGVVDRVGDNISGLAQGGVTAVQDLIARIIGGDSPKVSPTGTRVARSQASKVRRTANAAADGVGDTVGAVSAGTTKTVRAAKSGAKATATTAKRSAKKTAAAAGR